MHSTQRMFGCTIQEDGHSSSFWQFGFDGQDHLSLDLETLTWVSAEPMAMRTKRWWELERCYAEYNKAYLDSLCLTSLRRYLELGGQHLTWKGKARPVAMQSMVPHSHSQELFHLTEKLGVGRLCPSDPDKPTGAWNDSQPAEQEESPRPTPGEIE